MGRRFCGFIRRDGSGKLPNINIIDVSKLKVGDKVYYQPSHFSKTDWENGMVKEIPDFTTDKTASVGYNCIRVVYNCGGDWKNFKNYTGALTNLRDLKLGWKYQSEEL